MNERWREEVARYCDGWHTWYNDSVLSYVRPSEGIGLRLCCKDYQRPAFLENVRIGEDVADILPKGHAYDDSYTELSVVWNGNHFDVTTGTCGDDLVILVRCDDRRVKPSSLLIEGMSLYRSGAVVTRDKDGLRLNDVPVYVTKAENGELYAPLTAPYLSVDLDGEIGVSTGRPYGLDEIKDALARRKRDHERRVASHGDASEAYRAMQTCLAWDTVYDPTMRSPITTVSRTWNIAWGGYVMFCWDTFFGALMLSLDDKTLAYANVFAMLGAVADAGFVPNYACPNGFKSFDRSQPPVGSMTCLDIYRRYRETWFLAEVFPALLRWNRWFATHRTTPNGLLTWGSEPHPIYFDNVREHDGINERQGASYESGMDNSPMYENTPFDAEKHILMLDDVGLSGLYIEDCRCLAEIASVLGKDAERDELTRRAEAVENGLESLWDEETGLYLNRRTDTGALEKRLTPFHFFALFSAKATEKRKRRMIEEHLLNENEFWTNYPIPSVAKSDPAYVKQFYWQGRVWAPLNYLVFRALRRAGDYETAEKLASRSRDLILREWRRCGHVHENYDPETGEGCTVGRSDPFYFWGGLLAYLSFADDPASDSGR